ncbi:purine nucleoside permease [Mucilaginibacter sp. OAE612]|uniref:nucleoside hydrolase-like domain-containing protein n=1 Tax=Mucilaginibacter sp. OAE612 TaxID=3156444 RepID=UPI00359D1674
MKTRLMPVALLVLSIVLATHITASGQIIAKHRLIVITDIGNEPDDFMSMVRLMLYANQIDVVGLIASTSIHQSKKVSPELIEKVIRSYEKVQMRRPLKCTMRN